MAMSAMYPCAAATSKRRSGKTTKADKPHSQRGAGNNKAATTKHLPAEAFVEKQIARPAGKQRNDIGHCDGTGGADALQQIVRQNQCQRMIFVCKRPGS